MELTAKFNQIDIEADAKLHKDWEYYEK